jgi:GntR family transcriptional regulator/MocR family aminotransferase
MAGGERVAFLGSFSRVLLPSVRISYIILPKGTGKHYQEIKNYFNQTASKAEQIALAQFLRDGHLNRHIKKIRKLQEEKRLLAISELNKHFSSDQILFGDSGMEIALKLTANDIQNKLNTAKIAANIIGQENNTSTILLTFSRIPEDKISEAIDNLALINN